MAVTPTPAKLATDTEGQTTPTPKTTVVTTTAKASERDRGGSPTPKKGEKTNNIGSKKESVETEDSKMSSDGEDFDYEDAGFDDDDIVMDEDAYSETSAPIEDDDDDGYNAFDTMEVDKASKKAAWEITYKIKSVQDLQKEQKSQVDKVASLIETDPSTAATLLRHYRWNSEKLSETYWEDPARTLLAAGLSPPSSPSTSTKPLPPNPKRTKSSSSTTRTKSRTGEPFECSICFMDYPADEISTETLSLTCEHRFCKECWRHYLEGKILDEAESGRVQCMQEGCKRIVGEKVVFSLVGEKAADRYRTLLDRTYVDDSPYLKWCPHPECEYAIECRDAPDRKLNQIIPTVKCGCEKEFCFGCAYTRDHRPLVCKYVKLWEKKCADDSETGNWLVANTKECSKCHSTIEKNGGCNHMTCRKCRYEFCWVCLGDWHLHGTSYYQCNRYDDGADNRTSQEKSRASLHRYLHYFNRWANHEQSARLDEQLYQKTERKMEEIQHTSELTWIEVQFVKRAADVLLEARMTLKWTYAMAFYLKKCNSTYIFEDNQANLESAVEDLSGMLEQPIDATTIMKLKTDMVNKTNYVEKRAAIILNDTLQGHYESRWEFSQ